MKIKKMETNKTETTREEDIELSLEKYKAEAEFDQDRTDILIVLLIETQIEISRHLENIAIGVTE
jgi:hypothetical protein